MATLYLMAGVPGSGKSTYAKANLNGTYVSRDEIRFKLVDNKSEYFSKEKLVFKIFVETIQKALDAGEDVIADSTLIGPGGRTKLLNALHIPSDYCIHAIQFNIPLEVCLARNANRTGMAFVPEDVIKSMHKSLIPITEQELSKWSKSVVVTEVNE